MKLTWTPRLRDVFLESGMTIRGLSKMLGYSESHISRVIYGESNPSLPLLISLCSEFGVSLDYVCGMDKGKR